MSTFRVRLSQGNNRTGDGSLDNYSRQTGTITAASNASPIVITSASHGLTTGRRVTVQNVSGNTAANGDWVITVLSANTFSLNGSTGDGSYTSGGTWVTDSVQRTMYCMGPNKVNRKLKDGQEFTDCNYWKKFTYPTLPLSEAFIDVVEDDGSVYVEGATSYSFPVVYNFSVLHNGTYADYEANFISDYGAPATAVQITVTNADVNCKLNGSSSAIILIDSGTTQTIDNMNLSKIQFDNTISGSTTSTVQVLATITVTCNS